MLHSPPINTALSFYFPSFNLRNLPLAASSVSYRNSNKTCRYSKNVRLLIIRCLIIKSLTFRILTSYINVKRVYIFFREDFFRSSTPSNAETERDMLLHECTYFSRHHNKKRPTIVNLLTFIYLQNCIQEIFILYLSPCLVMPSTD